MKTPAYIKEKLPRYTYLRINKDRHRKYFYRPPQKYIDLGLVEGGEIAQNLTVACRIANERNTIIDDYRKSLNIPFRKGMSLSNLMQNYRGY